jgi:hypothetical protein
MRFQVPSRKDSREPISLVLKNQPQPSTAIRSTVNDVNIFEAAVIAAKIVVVEEALLGSFRFDAVVAKVLTLPFFLVSSSHSKISQSPGVVLNAAIIQ